MNSKFYITAVNILKIWKSSVGGFFLCFLLANCSSVTKTWQYSPHNYRNEETGESWKQYKVDKNVGVQVFTENLSDGGVSKDRSGIAMIPLVLYSKSHFSRSFGGARSMHHIKPKGECVRQIDTGEGMIFNPVISLSHALYSEFVSSKLFQNVEYICSVTDAEKKTDYLIEGVITDFSLDVKLYSYFIGFVNILAPLPWLIGLPITVSTPRLFIELRMIDLEKDSVVLKKIYKKQHKPIYTSLYSTKSSFMYPEMASEVYVDFMHEVRNFLHPDLSEEKYKEKKQEQNNA